MSPWAAVFVALGAASVFLAILGYLRNWPEN